MTIRQFLDRKALTAHAFAEQVGVDKGTMSRWLSGETVPAGEHIRLLLLKSGGELTVDGILAPSRRRKRSAA